jgi:phage portal protein BeeE
LCCGLREWDALFEGQPQGLCEEGRDAVWTYFHEVSCTQRANARSAFGDGPEGRRAEAFEDAWKAWTKSFVK